jgi:F-box/leucine-rich repeat protein 15
MLEIVALSGCWEVDNECLITLVMSCPKITQLCVNGCYGITDTLLHILSRQLAELARLELDGCWRITNRAIRMVGEYCHKLRYLNVKDCRDISEASLARLRAKGVIINRKPEIQTSQILTQYFNKPAMHMTPLRFDPT